MTTIGERPSCGDSLTRVRGAVVEGENDEAGHEPAERREVTMRRLQTMFTILMLALIAFACGCGGPQTVEVEVTRIVPQTVEVAQEVGATRVVPQTVEVTREVEVTRVVPQTVEVTREVEVTRVVPQTVEVTREIQVVVTATPRPATPTPEPTATPEIVAAVGVPIRCGDVFQVTVLEPARFSKYTSGETAIGTFLIINLQLLNLTEATYGDLFDEDYEIRGVIDGREATFTSSWHASWDLCRDKGTASFTDEAPPGVPFKTIVAFDVNPDGQDWTLLFHPNSYIGNADCSVEIPVQ